MSKKEYIERNALIAEYDRVHIGPPGGARKLMVDAPTADVTEAVRCSECKYAAEVEYMGCACKNEKTPWCNDEFEVYMNPTDFCSYGERRTE